MTITASDVLDAILSGHVDDDLDAIAGAVRDRRKNAGRSTFHFAKIGSTGRLAEVIRPKYLVGAPVTVVDKNNTRIVVTVDPDWLDRHPQAKARWAGRVTCPPELLVLDEAS